MDGKKGIARERQSNFEFLRIISMLFIIVHHYSVHGGFDFSVGASLSNEYLMNFVSLFGKIGVNIFVLISGYFLVTSRFKPSKLVKLWLQIIFFSVAFFVLRCVFDPSALTTENVIKTIMPLSYNDYWFATDYILLYLFSPFLNAMITKISKAQHAALILVLFLVWSLLPTLAFVLPYGISRISTLGFFVFLYLISSYIRLYLDGVKISAVKCFVVAGGSFC